MRNPILLLDRYLLRQLVLPLLIGLCVFVVILMAEAALNLGQALTGMRVPAGPIVRYFANCLPRTVAWSLPVGILVGVAMVSTTLGRNGEATAARAGGVSLQRIWACFVVVGLLGSAASFLLEEEVVPKANERATQAFLQMTNSQPVLRAKDEQVFQDRSGRLFYVGHMDPRTNRLRSVMVIENDPQGRLATITTARWAQLEGRRWVLRDGWVHRFTPTGDPAGKPQRLHAQEIWLTEALQSYWLDQRSEFDLSTHEMRKAAQAMEAAGQEQDAQRMRVRLQFKYSIPLACLVFALVAAPLAARYAHLGSFAGIVLSILVVFLYNGVRSWGLAFGLVGDLPPVVAAWAQNILFGGLGLWLFCRAR